MSTALADLVADLQADVPARDGIPSANQYERCVRDAVADFSRRTGRTKIATLSIVSGTATYPLPADFLKVVKLESLQQPEGVMHTASGLVPMTTLYSETYTIADGQITFIPTPGYTISRYLHYKAGWVLDGADEYQEMDQQEAEIALMLAASKALTMQANKAAQAAWSYQIGDERVSKERLAGELRAQAKQATDDYKAAVEAYNGSAAVRSDYASNAYQ